MGLNIVAKTKFHRDVKRMRKRGKNIKKLESIIETLRDGKVLAVKHRQHWLTGEWEGCLECHIEPDWIMIYTLHAHALILIRTGTHSDLFC